MTGLVIGRRALPLLGLAAALAPARADTIDLALTCDTTLAPLLRKLGAAYTAQSSARVFVFPTGPGLILPQLERNIQNDILVTQTPVLDQATQQGLIADVAAASWRNPLVIGALPGGSVLDQTLAVTDPTPASDIDGPAVLTRLGLKPRRVLGAVDSEEVAFLIANGSAQAGLLHMTDVRAHGLEVVQPVPPDVWVPAVYRAGITRLADRPNPGGFLAFLATQTAVRLLSDGGLEVLT
jgi:ABC-type molybdate transport system substrate-binding protein